jgi:O-antigen/teichoic acid export membrane protein
VDGPLSLIVNVILNVVLIPTFGINGSGAAVIVSEIAGAMLISVILRRDLHLHLHVVRESLRPLAACAIASATYPLWHDPRHPITTSRLRH